MFLHFTTQNFTDVTKVMNKVKQGSIKEKVFEVTVKNRHIATIKQVKCVLLTTGLRVYEQTIHC